MDIKTSSAACKIWNLLLASVSLAALFINGLKLVGEWFDYGFDKTVIILPGRRETLVYSYYYAQPYKELGINVLVIDQRAHGLSEGTYSTCGIKEADDVKLWLK